MVSGTSKTLPFIALGIILFAMTLSVLGYQEIVNTFIAALPVLVTVAGGGLINKHIEAGLEKYELLSKDPNVKKLIEELVARATKKTEP